METITIHAAKTTLPQPLARVEAGEKIILAHGNEPIAKLVPYQAPPTKRRCGALRGIITTGPAFFEPLSEEELAEWE